MIDIDRVLQTRDFHESLDTRQAFISYCGYPKHDDEQAFCDAAVHAGISLQPLSLFCHSVSLPPAVLVGYAALTMAQIRYAGRNLGKLLHSRSSRS